MSSQGSHTCKRSGGRHGGGGRLPSVIRVTRTTRVTSDGRCLPMLSRCIALGNYNITVAIRSTSSHLAIRQISWVSKGASAEVMQGQWYFQIVVLGLLYAL